MRLPAGRRRSQGEVVVAKYANVEEYLAHLPEDRRGRIEQLRAAVRAAAPDAVETISYNMPAYRMGGRFVVSFEAFKAHDSVFPASAVVVAQLGAEIEPYLAGKGTIRFPADRPIPTDLITRIVEIRVAENAAAAADGASRQ